MNYTEKIILTILFGIGGLILPKVMEKINGELKRKLEVSNPEFVKNQSWVFSKTKIKLIRWVFLIMLAGWIIIIWTTNIKIGR